MFVKIMGVRDMIVNKEDVNKLMKTKKLLGDDGKLHLYLPYILNRGETMDEPITIEHSVGETAYYLNKDAAVLDSVINNSAIIQEEVMTNKKVLVLLHLAIPEKNSRKEDQFPSEMIVHEIDEFMDPILGIMVVNVDTEFLEMDPFEIIGIKFDKLKVKNIDESGKATEFEYQYTYYYTDNSTEDREFDTNDIKSNKL